jgi:hypothetical protein
MSTPYPNIGYMVLSSHTKIFDHISLDQTSSFGTLEAPDIVLSAGPHSQLADDRSLRKAACALRQLLSELQLTAMRDLIMFWRAKGANLGLAEPFVDACAENVIHILTTVSQDETWRLSCARLLSRNSTHPLEIETTYLEFLACFLGPKFRWEALGIFFLAVSRATIDIPFFPRLCMATHKKCLLRKATKELSDCA